MTLFDDNTHMAEAIERPDTGAKATTTGHPQGFSSKLGGWALIAAAVLLVIEFSFDQFLVNAQAYEGPAALLTVVTNPLWVPWRLVFVAGPVALSVGLVAVAIELYRANETFLAGLAGSVLGVSVVLYVLEFVIAAIAAPSLFLRPRGTGLSQAEVQHLLMGYQSIGIGLLALATILLGIGILVVCIGLYRTERVRSGLALAGLVAGAIVIWSGFGRLGPVGLNGIVALIAFALVLAWLVVLGGHLLRPNVTAG